MKRVGVVLSGCGVFDGSEIHEAVLTLLALSRAGAQAVCLAPDREQTQVIDHRSGEAVAERRNMLAEAARIARGEVTPLAQGDASQLDALIVPGGFGAAKNLSSLASDGAACWVDSDLQRLVRELHQAGKPLGFICIAPALLPKLLGAPVRVTIGNDAGTIAAIEAMGGQHVACPVDEIVVDTAQRVVTTPAYMLAGSIAEAAQGIDKLVAQVLEMTR
ncbi:isoprenoid biosynthesis glyoxalase ElbB [Edwardsiella tarda]|uniref:Glyoxalase n=1 Tax=Edwardsiella tarda ATCC 23685 TaxID=500638 RepID=D4F1A5_EDWTA|nr:isoprenoid biosynthesis glyoxalase ElbB [Edwardsiella tarda]ATI63707.1 isoprenoid biosynthesis protein ElbB [Edwardsiella tarda]EFE24430.1 enhancing lycopene biosynthesis protein 2 [Edwardsiella tarda ATCC 23685]UCQ17400.1 isoprenoid biosynthesis glyoxalase ElbB [Edwardsiella tarda]UCQ27190.1 isoprenoid biosynthesis glyoxalase ElbB [Edwardsiella tarda]BEH73622.1 isoprenoid biosynthesis glyoxalase ElbB [Edwardsiella tarda]